MVCLHAPGCRVYHADGQVVLLLAKAAGALLAGYLAELSSQAGFALLPELAAGADSCRSKGITISRAPRSVSVLTSKAVRGIRPQMYPFSRATLSAALAAGAIMLPLIGLGETNRSFRPGAIWPDTSGRPINAHAAGILYQDGTYYWFGEKRGRGQECLGVSVYSSRNL